MYFIFSGHFRTCYIAIIKNCIISLPLEQLQQFMYDSQQGLIQLLKDWGKISVILCVFLLLLLILCYVYVNNSYETWVKINRQIVFYFLKTVSEKIEA